MPLLTVLASLEDSYSGWSSRHPGCPTFPEQRLRSRGRDFSEVTSQDFRCQQGQSSFATQLCLLCFRSFFLRLWTLVNYGPLAVEWAKDAETLSSTLFAGWCTASGRFIAARMPPEQVPEQVLPGDGSIFGGVPATFSAHSMCLEPATIAGLLATHLVKQLWMPGHP